MSDLELENPNETIELTTAQELADQAYAEIDTKYGTEGRNPKGYHNVAHTRDDVVGGIIELADLAITSGKITPRDKALLIIIGAFHDIEQDLGSGQNETASARKTRVAMRKTSKFTDDDEDVVDVAIMGTQIRFEGGVMLQSASAEDSFLAQLMADADLSSLGRDTETYWVRSVGLLTELSGDKPTVEDQVAFLESQIRLLQQHEYYTDEARELFPHQKENLEYTEAVLASLTT
jgi:hypothetical protein